MCVDARTHTHIAHIHTSSLLHRTTIITTRHIHFIQHPGDFTKVYFMWKRRPMQWWAFRENERNNKNWFRLLLQKCENECVAERGETHRSARNFHGVCGMEWMKQRHLKVSNSDSIPYTKHHVYHFVQCKFTSGCARDRKKKRSKQTHTHTYDIVCTRDREQMERNIDRYSDNYIVPAAAAEAATTTSTSKNEWKVWFAHTLTSIHSAKMIVFVANGQTAHYHHPFV